MWSVSVHFTQATSSSLSLQAHVTGRGCPALFLRGKEPLCLWKGPSIWIYTARWPATYVTCHRTQQKVVLCSADRKQFAARMHVAVSAAWCHSWGGWRWGDIHPPSPEDGPLSTRGSMILDSDFFRFYLTSFFIFVPGSFKDTMLN